LNKIPTIYCGDYKITYSKIIAENCFFILPDFRVIVSVRATINSTKPTIYLARSYNVFYLKISKPYELFSIIENAISS